MFHALMVTFEQITWRRRRSVNRCCKSHIFFVFWCHIDAWTRSEDCSTI